MSLRITDSRWASWASSGSPRIYRKVMIFQPICVGVSAQVSSGRPPPAYRRWTSAADRCGNRCRRRLRSETAPPQAEGFQPGLRAQDLALAEGRRTAGAGECGHPPTRHGGDQVRRRIPRAMGPVTKLLVAVTRAHRSPALRCPHQGAGGVDEGADVALHVLPGAGHPAPSADGG